MVNRTKIPKEIYRRTGGAGKTGNGTKVKDLKPKDWEQVPGTGGSPHNPPRFRLTKEAKKRQQTQFKLKQAKKKEEATKPAVEDLYKGVKEGAPYARLTGAARRGAKEAHLARDIRSRDIDDFPSQPRNRAIIDELKRAQDIKRRSVSPPTTPRSPVPLVSPPRISAPSRDLSAIPSGVPESERERILWGVGHSGSEEFTKGGKVAKSKGGTVKKMRGGTLHKKKNKKSYDNHHGGKLVASLYE